MAPRTPLVVPAIALSVALGVVLGACSGGPVPSATRTGAVEPVELTIYGAASLKGALEVVEEAYEAANPGTTLSISTDSSAALATQIEQGAPADVFLSADTRNPQALADRGLTEGAPVSFAGNALAVVVPAENRARIASPADLARPGIKIIAAGDGVPITGYAAQLVVNLAGQPGYPAGFAEASAANVVSREDNVGAIVAKVGLGEGDAGIVYRTDATASDQVTSIDVPDAANVTATYDGVVLNASPHAVQAKAFLDWLVGADGQAILAGFGFTPPPAPPVSRPTPGS